MSHINGRKVLVLGASGAMGTYLVPELIELGYDVHAVALDGVSSNAPCFTCINANAKDPAFLREQLKNRYDAVVDFMLYTTKEFEERYPLLAGNTGHYFFFSTYRIYADHAPITEESPRLLDVATDKEYLATYEREYSLYKAMQEDIVRASRYGNWTILRPAITYSKRRFQLVTLEADTVIYRARKKLPILLPQEALPVQGTMSWAGDVARLLARLVLNPAAVKETFTVSTAEHHTWQEIADIYKELIGLEILPVDRASFLQCLPYDGKYQLTTDRCFNRIVDNAKILRATGLSQSEFTSLRDGLKKELSALPQDAFAQENEISRRMDAFLTRKEG